MSSMLLPNMVRKVLVLCRDYNGSEVKFMMKSDDFRLNDSRFSENYIVLDHFPVYTHKTQTLKSDWYGRFKVFSDWSLREVV